MTSCLVADRAEISSQSTKRAIEIDVVLVVVQIPLRHHGPKLIGDVNAIWLFGRCQLEVNGPREL